MDTRPVEPPAPYGFRCPHCGGPYLWLRRELQPGERIAAEDVLLLDGSPASNGTTPPCGTCGRSDVRDWPTEALESSGDLLDPDPVKREERRQALYDMFYAPRSAPTRASQRGDGGTDSGVPPLPDLEDPRQLKIADESYRPIPEFREWAGLRIDQEGWARATARLDRARREASPEDFRAAVVVAMRAAAVDTGAIEGLYKIEQGFTMSVALQSAAWQVEMQGHGVDIMPYFEAQLRAYDLALDAAAQKAPISEAWIRSLHEELTAPQTTVRVLTSQGPREAQLLKGEYKRLPNHVRQVDGAIHAYAPVLQTADEMYRLVAQLRLEDFEAAHAVLQAAYAHYCLVAIHPFQDGNGRVARALASVYLYRDRAASVPLVIFNDQKSPYLDALARADAAAAQAFVDFIFDRTIEAIDLVATQIGASIERSLTRLGTLLIGPGGLQHTQIDQIGYQLQEAVAKELEEHIRQTALPAGLALQVQKQSGGNVDAPMPEGYRTLANYGHEYLTLYATVQSPAHVSVNFVLRVLASQQSNVRIAFVVQATDPAMPGVGGSETLDVRLADVHPEYASSFRLRLATWTKFVINRLLTTLTDRTTEVLKRTGH